MVDWKYAKFKYWVYTCMGRADRQTGWHADRQSYRWICRQGRWQTTGARERQTGRHSDKQTDRRKDTQTEIHTDGLTDR